MLNNDEFVLILLLGLMFPFFINIFSLRKVFSKSLRDSLDFLNRKLDNNIVVA